MTNKEKIEYVLEKFPETKFDRCEFFIRFMETYYGVLYYITFAQFREFWKDFSGVERELRECLKGRLTPEQDAIRYAKSEQFRQEHI